MLSKKILFPFLLIFIIFGGIALYHRYSPQMRVNVPVGLATPVDFETLTTLENVIPIAVLGSGPAGLSAALYGARAGTDTVVFAGPTPMGQLTGTSFVENWPGVPKVLGTEVMNTLKQQAETFGARYILDSVKKIDCTRWPFKLTTADGNTVHALTVVIATGANPRLLGIEGEKEYWGKGVTTCAVCDAPYYKDGKVIVVGGGDSAAEEAMQLAPYACSITIMVRSNAMRASAIMQDRLKEYPNITVQYNTEVTKIIGDGKQVTEVELFDNKIRKTSKIEIDGVFLAIGHIPNTQIFESQLAMNREGIIALDHPTQKTSVQGIFAAGEVADEQYRQAGVSAGDGIKAALDALAFLRDIGFSEKEAQRISDRCYLPTRVARMPLEKIKTADELEQKVLKAKGTVVLDFYADYCGSCLQMMPAMEEIAQEFADSVAFYKVDAAVAEDIANQFFVTSLPTILIFKDGKIDARYTKAMNKQELREIF